MESRIKLIWDFYGTNSLKIAEHYEIHLKEYLLSIEYPIIETGISNESNNHCVAFIIIFEKDMIMFRDKLKPTRGEKVNLF